jgi:hypothetical protein
VAGAIFGELASGPALCTLGSNIATAHLDQQFRHPLKCLVIFNLLGQPCLSACFATSFCSGLAQYVSDVRVYDERLLYLRLILPPRALPSSYVAASLRY